MGSMLVEVGTGYTQVPAYNPEALRRGDMYVSVDLPTVVGEERFSAEALQLDPQIPFFDGGDIAFATQPLNRTTEGHLAAAAFIRPAMHATATRYRMLSRGVGIHALLADGQQLPFSDDSVDELVMRRVMGDDMLSEMDRLKLLEEAGRVVKPTGRIAIVEATEPGPHLTTYPIDKFMLSTAVRASMLGLGLSWSTLTAEHALATRFNSPVLSEAKRTYILRASAPRV